MLRVKDFNTVCRHFCNRLRCVGVILRNHNYLIYLKRRFKSCIAVEEILLA